MRGPLGVLTRGVFNGRDGMTLLVGAGASYERVGPMVQECKNEVRRRCSLDPN